MRIAITAMGEGLDAEVSPIFGRAPFFLLLDTENEAIEAVRNPSIDAPGGAGIRSAQIVSDAGVEALVTGRVGPNAARVLREAGLELYRLGGATVRENLEAFRAGSLESLDDVGEAGYGGKPGGGMGGGRGGGGGGGGMGGGLGGGRGGGMGGGRGGGGMGGGRGGGGMGGGRGGGGGMGGGRGGGGGMGGGRGGGRRS